MWYGCFMYGYDFLDFRSIYFFYLKAERFMIEEGYVGATKFGGICNDAL